MRVLFNIGHPAQVHLFKNLARNLEKNGHEYRITVVNKDVSVQLLSAYGFTFNVVGAERSSLFSKAKELLAIERQLYNTAKIFRPDILVGGPGNAYVCHVGKLIKKPSVVFDDTEHARIEHILMDRFASTICTPSCYKKALGKNQIRYDGYHELSYLHPNWFRPDPAVLDELELGEKDVFFLLRFAAFDASHDLKSNGLRKEYVLPIIHKLEKYGRIVISSEVKLDKSLEQYRYKLSPEKYHHVLYYSSMYMGESSTSAEEAAVMGVPSLHFERLSRGGASSGITPLIGVLDELQNKYGLLYSYYDEGELVKKLDEILGDLDNAKKEWKAKKDRLLIDKIDVTKFMTELIENYPESLKIA